MRAHLLLLVLLLCAPTAWAQSRAVSLDHAGSVGLIAAGGVEFATTEIADCVTCQASRTIAGFDGFLDLGGTVAVGSEGNEVALRLRLTRLTVPGESILLGFRNYFGRDELKTFAAFDLVGMLRPVQAGGARAAFGVAYDFSPLFGLWAEAGASFALGAGRRFGAELGVGLHGRSYLLE